MIYQRTLADIIDITGIGIHSGKKARLKLYPAEADTGVIFKRVDLKDAEPLKAHAHTVGATKITQPLVVVRIYPYS